jgi:hypothetical protein
MPPTEPEDHDWTQIFFADELGDSDAESDGDYEPETHDDQGSESEYEDEDISTTADRSRTIPPMDGNIHIKVKQVLNYMDSIHIDLPIFMDALSWGDPGCIQDPTIRGARSALMTSPRLPGILERWWKPPQKRSRKVRPRGARPVLTNLMQENWLKLLNREMGKIGKILVSPAGEDLKEETLTGLDFQEMISDLKEDAPNLWKTLEGLAWSARQAEENKKKEPDTVRKYPHRSESSAANKVG